MKRCFNKRGGLFHQILIQIILVSLILFLFFLVNGDKIDSRNVKQQILEKQIALMINSAVVGMEFSISKFHQNGKIDDIRIENGRIFVDVDGLGSVKGYAFFSKYNIILKEEGDDFFIKIQ